MIALPLPRPTGNPRAPIAAASDRREQDRGGGGGGGVGEAQEEIGGLIANSRRTEDGARPVWYDVA